MNHGKGTIAIIDLDSGELAYFSRQLMCPTTGIAYQEPEPNTFSFNSPKGACPHCDGIGTTKEVNLDKVMPDLKKTIRKGGLAPVGEYKKNWIFNQLEIIAMKYGFNLDTALADIPDEALEIILHGTNEVMTIEHKTIGVTKEYKVNFEGVIHFIANQSKDAKSRSIQRWADDFMENVTCGTCGGARLRKESLHFKMVGQSISDVSTMSLIDFNNWIDSLPSHLNEKEWTIASEISKELKARTAFLLDVGLGYLNVNRSARSLSGGEAQRIRLATQIGSQLVNVLYILDEPSIGLHQRDNARLIHSLKQLRDIGNSVIVVEHDKEMIETADHILDIGPKAGIHGGYIVAQGTIDDILRADTITADYLNGKRNVPIPAKRRSPRGYINLYGATGNNLNNVDVRIPLGILTCITGVSGSGKSTLINGTLYPILNHLIFRAVGKPQPYTKIEGTDQIDKIIDIDQSPIGRTPRSNPATYTGVWSEIRQLFAGLSESKIRGYKPGRYSFNVKGGRCETCEGGGLRVIEMNFLPDVYVHCETCQGKRFNRETLEIRYKGKSISDVLNMSIEDALPFFELVPKINAKLQTMANVGLGYIRLGQPSTTLSGGEAQRVKLATELSKKDTGNTMYILDEPTTGLHFEDVRVLMEVIQQLVEQGNTVLIIEHNMDVIKQADHVIDLGPEGGTGGGYIVAEGTPEEIISIEASITAQFLKLEL